MKKAIAILLTALMLVSILPAGALAASTKTVYISSTGSGSMNLRAGPGTDYSVKGFVYHGDKVTVLDTSGIWSRVKTNSGKTGWIKTKYIDGTTKALGTGYKYISTSGGALNLRSGAGTGYSIRGKVYDGAKVKVLNTEGSWARISVQSSGATGWILTKYLSSSGSSSGSSSSSSSSGSGQKVYHVSSASLNMRYGAGTGYGVKATLYRGCAFRVLESSGNWYRISTFSGVTGWVSKSYVSSGATATVKAGSLNMRASASTSGKVIKSLGYGAKVTVSRVIGNWARVTSGGQTGYVSLNYLSL